MTNVISVEHLSKQYDLGVIGTGTLTRDLERWWARIRHKPDPYSLVGTDTEKSWLQGSILALDDVSFTVQQGEALGIIGKNGAGKSTLLKILSRVTAPTSGVVKVKGRIGSLLEVGTGFHPELTGRENVYLNGTILGMKKAEVDRKFDEIVAFSGVEKFIDTPVKRYSSGMYVRLAFAVAAHLDPEILIVDEVLAVGDAEFQKKCLGKMGDVAGEGRTVLFVSHNMVSIEHLCERSLLVDQGRVVKDGQSNEVIEFYLQQSQMNGNNGQSLSSRTDRKGNGEIKLTDFYLLDSNGNKTQIARSGEDVLFCFEYEKNTTKSVRNVDIGFSVHSGTNQQALSVFYSSYNGVTFSNIPAHGIFQCLVPNFPFSKGRLLIGARVLVDNVESDWPQNGIGYIDVEPGNYYNSGKIGFEGNAPLLINGQWKLLDNPYESSR